MLSEDCCCLNGELSSDGLDQFAACWEGLEVPAGRHTGLLPRGHRVAVLSRDGDWALVDATGDGSAEGFVYSPFLRRVPST